MEKRIKLTYWVSTTIFSLVILGSIFLYLTQYERFSKGFLTLGYPSYLVYPLVVIKFLGLVAIWTRKVDWLKEWAYAGFFFNLVLSLAAHFSVGSGKYHNALVAIIFLIISYAAQKYVFKKT